MGQPEAPRAASFNDVPSALTAFAGAAADAAAHPDDAERHELYDAVRRGVEQAVAALASDVEFRSRTTHYDWHRRALRTLLEEPEVQPTEARYLGYLSALRAVARELHVTWPPYGPDDRVHDRIPPEALTPEPAAVARRPMRKR